MANGQEPIEIIKAPFVAKITEINGNESDESDEVYMLYNI